MNLKVIGLTAALIFIYSSATAGNSETEESEQYFYRKDPDLGLVWKRTWEPQGQEIYRYRGFCLGMSIKDVKRRFGNNVVKVYRGYKGRKVYLYFTEIGGREYISHMRVEYSKNADYKNIKEAVLNTYGEAKRVYTDDEYYPSYKEWKWLRSYTFDKGKSCNVIMEFRIEVAGDFGDEFLCTLEIIDQDGKFVEFVAEETGEY